MAIYDGNEIEVSTGVVWKLRVKIDSEETEEKEVFSYDISLGAKSTNSQVTSWDLSKSEFNYDLTCDGDQIASGSFPPVSSYPLSLSTETWRYARIASGTFEKARTSSGTTEPEVAGSLWRIESHKSECTFTVTVPILNRYTVTFRKRDGSLYRSVTTYYGHTVAKPDNPTERGYTFNDWYTDSDLTNKASFPYRVTQDQPMYSAWSLTSKVYARVNGTWVQIPKPMAKNSSGVWKECDVYVKVNGSWVKLN